MDIDKANLKLIFFDLDKTLAESKSPITPEMGDLLVQLLHRYQVCVISGGKFEQFQKQLLGNLSLDEEISKNLHLMPTQGALYYKYENAEWIKKHDYGFNEEERAEIIEAFKNLIATEPSLQVETYGEQIEDRGGQITLSALGQQAPVDVKDAWDPDKKKRMAMREKLMKVLPNYKISLGGSTSIDITRQNLDKAFGVQTLCESLGLSAEKDCIYVGDDLQEGGNDYEALKTGIKGIPTSGPQQTMEIIQQLL